MTPSSSDPSAPSPSAGWQLLRPWGVLVFVFFLLTSAVGGSLAMESSYLVVTLASHIGLALVTLGLAGYTTSTIGRTYTTLPRLASALSALAALGATISGTIFYLGGQSNYALGGMIGLALLGILCGLLMIVFGGPSGKRVPSTSST